MTRMSTVDMPADDRLERSDAQIVLRRGGRAIGHLDWRSGPALIHIDYVYVDPSLRGHGVGARLVEAAVAHARETGRRLVPICGYARRMLSRDPACRDVLAEAGVDAPPRRG